MSASQLIESLRASASNLLKTHDTVRRGNMSPDRMRAIISNMQADLAELLEGIPS